MRLLLPLAMSIIGGIFIHETQAQMTWTDLTNRSLPNPTKSIKTGDGETELVDLWLPDGEGPHPVVLMIHGGCWQKRFADRTLMNHAAEALRLRGLAVWNIEYRGVDERGGGYPGTFLDVARAADALALHAEANQLATDRVVIFGHSAGGHLGLWLAARGKLPETSPLYQKDPLKIHTVINSGGLADLEASAPVTIPGCLSAILGQLTGPPSESRPNVFSDTSPSELLPFGTIQISVNGAMDGIAPPVLGINYTEKAILAGDVARSEVVQGAGHVELIAPETEAFRIQADLLEKAFQ